MLDEVKKHISSTRVLVTLLIVAVSIYLLQLAWQVLGNFSDVFVVLIASWLVSFILEPPVTYLTRVMKTNKLATAIGVYVLFLGLVTIAFIYLIPVVATQMQSLFILLPKYLATVPALSNSVNGLLTGGISTSLLVLPSVANFLLYAVLSLIISFYFIVDKQSISREIYNLSPKAWHKEMAFVEEVIDTTFASFLRVQLVFGLLAAITTWIVLVLFHVDFAITAALLAGVLTIIPLLGPMLGLIPPMLVVLFLAPGAVIPVFILLMIAQQVIFNVVGPKLLSNAFKIHPVVVLLSFIVGLKLAGGLGAVLAVPVLGILTVVIHRLSKHFLSEEK